MSDDKLKKRLKLAILQIHLCSWCHLPLGDDMTLDHTYPRWAGGVNHIMNLTVMHTSCNTEKGGAIIAKTSDSFTEQTASPLIAPNAMKIPLKVRLVNYIKNNPGWHASIALQRLTMEKAGQTGKSCSRRLQEATEEGLLEVSYVRGAAQYRFKGGLGASEGQITRNRPLQAFDLPATLQVMEEYYEKI